MGNTLAPTGAAWPSEYQAILEEQDPTLRAEGLSSLASRLERAGDSESAASVYASALHSLPADDDAALSNRIRGRLEAIQGQGAIGGRVEFLLNRFTKDAFDPKVIAPMMLGATVFSLTRTLALGRFGGSALFRTMGPRFAASSLGFAAEVPAFALSVRALRSAAGQEPSIGQELAGAAITLGFLKTFGRGAQVLGTKPWLGSGSGFHQQLLSQAAMFAGLLSAHKVEEGLGLRPHLDGATTVTDTLASMFNLGIGAGLAHRVLGSRYAAMQDGLNWRFHNHSIIASTHSHFPLAFHSRTLAVETISRDNISLSEGGGFRGGGNPQNDILEANKLIAELADHPNPTAEMMVGAERIIGKLLLNEEMFESRMKELSSVAIKLSPAEVEKLMELSNHEESWRAAGILLRDIRRHHVERQVRQRVTAFLMESCEPGARVRKKLESEGISWVIPETRQVIQEGKIEKAMLVAQEAFHHSLLENLGEKVSWENLQLLEDLLKLPHARIRTALYEVFDKFAGQIAKVEKPSADHPVYHLRLLIRRSPQREKFLLREDFLSNDPIRIYYAKHLSDDMSRLSQKENSWQK